MTEYYWVPEQLMFVDGETCLEWSRSGSEPYGPATKVADHVKYDELKKLANAYLAHPYHDGFCAVSQGTGKIACTCGFDDLEAALYKALGDET